MSVMNPNLEAAQSQLDPFGTEQMTAALLGRGSISVDEMAVMSGGSAVVGGGNRAGQVGAAIGGLGRQVMNSQAPPTPQQFQKQAAAIQKQSKGAKGVLMGTDLVDAMMQSQESSGRYARTQQSRFKGGVLGLGESVYDLVNSKQAREEMQDDRRVVLEKTEAYQQRQLQAEFDKDQERRKDYIDNVLPLIKYNNPDLSEDAAMSLATTAAAQNMPIEKLLPEGLPTPMKEEYVDPETGAKMARFRNPKNGAIMTEEQYKPFMVATPTDKTKGSETKWQIITDEAGNQFQTQFGVPDANGEPQILQQIPIGVNKNVKPFAAMPEAQRKYGGMVANTSKLIADGMPYMFDTNGNWNSVAVQVPNSKAKAAYEGYKNAIIQSIRPESGAAVPPEEKTQAMELYFPNLTDGDVTAQAKVQRFARYQRGMHDAFFGQFTDVPVNLGYSDYTMPWLDTLPGAIGSEIVDQEEGDAELNAEYEAAMKRAAEANR